MDPYDVAPQRPELRIERAGAVDGVTCLAVAGEVDMTTGEQFERTLIGTLDEPGVTRLLLDVAPLRFIDSNGVAVLVKARRTADAHGIVFGLVNARGVVRSVLEMLGVYEMLAAERGR
jgi:anti-sigma B factor antagonist